ncbi:hypothetical protein HMPREF0578_2099 [Mobiluncus mulieris 28-1]|uniref:Uncharacterized protein n=1 Tax=Mobiluncus mulieris ATCC 35239 TaxID=871571 RepID=E0QS33_9ACTO|nr:hypothetical protein HMPREF0577_1034 [Mobiluncus mulieris ATCC 35243]EEZ91027.1 hypothetical protein HMPREF0578_2099 [Mobiluncus mulieris 28-1]EFM45609.1 hypothetical protein HMPREF0580_1698 [Mobiluncus mulieris ATCC 35239]EFN93140.1 hypothetical protein HMPREF9278_1714 [Mobiluncus mulieris FB024-16]
MTRHDRAAQFAPYAPLTSFCKVLTDAALKGDSKFVAGKDKIAETDGKPRGVS